MEDFNIRLYDVDRNLGYVIQQVTGDSTQEILSYFFRVAQFALIEICKKTKANYLNKTIILHYKDTPIVYAIKIFAGSLHSEPRADINVKFPSKSQQFDVKELMMSIVESGLELTDSHNLPKFNRPELKTPKCLRKVKEAQDEQRSKTTT